MAERSFLLVIPGCDLVTTIRRANQIKELISSQPILTPVGETAVTVSMGVNVAESSTNSKLLLRLADTALYQAKHKGRNRVEQAISAAIVVSAS
jgi:diguanylate cyclase (GGDEF)-like protein